MPCYQLPVIGQELPFYLHKIICIGRNYAEHAREMGHDPEREPPFFFFKPQSALAQNNSHFYYPKFSQHVDYEVELVVAIGKAGKNIAPEKANEYIFGFALGLDMTCRDQQKTAKQLGRPWELGKGFDGSAPCTAIEKGDLATLEKFGELVLQKKNQEVQRGNWRDMVWAIPELIAEISKYTQLHEGDLIFTGTPAGVGPVAIGDRLTATLDNFSQRLSITISAAE